MEIHAVLLFPLLSFELQLDFFLVDFLAAHVVVTVDTSEHLVALFLFHGCKLIEPRDILDI